MIDLQWGGLGNEQEKIDMNGLMRILYVYVCIYIYI